MKGFGRDVETYLIYLGVLAVFFATPPDTSQLADYVQQPASRAAPVDGHRRRGSQRRTPSDDGRGLWI